ncbi:interferon regulatory factor 1 S homeolog [Xenopus laevis]|uniref:Interferon regulatory factor n=1 Tax=Xenopus laevis TaxID=8355 RepID=Q6GPX1_XENLA|nr:interferon regulatory factor 1 S homeolog [Xenopus laevis]AAH72984.1 MGC82544 protein [Xenopus laevis]
MPPARLRMRPWLEKQINSNKIPGLSWINKDEMIFQIPWKHAARHGWDINKDACLFQSWAVHTGRFKSGEKEADPKTWKANFRCAMNSLPDIKEVKDKSVYKGSSAVRVYQMLEPQIKAEKKERRSKANSKSRAKKKAEEDEESVKTSPLPSDHSYTANVYTDQEDMDSVDAAVMSINESISSNLDWNSQLEMPLPDSTNDLYPFQVSPLSSSSEEEDAALPFADDIFKMILEPSTEWSQTSVDGKGFFTNDSGMQTTCLTEISSAFDGTLSGEIKVRFSTDMLNWPESNISSRATGLAVPTF